MANTPWNLEAWSASTNLRVLKWVVIVLSIVFLAVADAVRHTIYELPLHSFQGLILTHAAIAIAIIVFSHGVFGLIARLQRRVSEQNRELSALLTVGKAVASSLDLGDVLGKSLETIIEVTTAEAAEIWLAEGDDELVMRAHRGVAPDALSERTRFKTGQGLPGIAASGHELIVVHDLPSDTGIIPQTVKQAGYHTFCALPMRYQGRLVGVLTVAALSKTSFADPWETRLLNGVGERVAVAIQNANLHQRVQDLAVLQERERIAREMHDGLGQVLGYINTQTLAVKKLISDSRLDDAREELTSMEDATRHLYADVREGILGLRMSPNSSGGLMQELGDYIERFGEMSGIDARLQVSPDAKGYVLTPSVEIQLTRVIQEALSNVRKHASAASVSVMFDQSNNDLEVVVVDDGHGFDPARTRSAGWPRFGLQTMRERAESVGGSFAVESSPGHGTRVVVRVPLHSEMAIA